MHFNSKPLDESTLGPKRRSTVPCRTCQALTVDVQAIDCGHDDYRITCENCGKSYIVEGDDG